MDVGFVVPFASLCALTMLSASGLTYLLRQWAPAWGLVDLPDGGRKRHRAPTALAGGAAIFLALLSGTFATHQLGFWSSPAPGWGTEWLWTAGLFCLIGLCDDRRPLRPGTKFCWQILACLPFACSQHRLQVLDLGFGGWELGSLGIPLTIFWLVACVNAFNLLDGLDGLASGTVILTCLAWAILDGGSGTASVVIPALLLASAIGGFLLHNRPPARIFLGDTGSLMLGFATGALGLEVGRNSIGAFSPWLPLIVLSIPLFDTSMAILRRKLSGRGIGEADREHIHHCLVDRGWSRPQVMLTIVAISGLQGVIAILGFLSDQTFPAVLAAGCVLGALICGRWFGHREFLGMRRFAAERLARLSGSQRFNPLEWLAF